MEFSARGYAQLTDLLIHIVVLEGGYSIEGALPYVMSINLGTSWFGLFLSKEPDWHPTRLKQSRQVTETIHEVVDQVWNLWENRKKANLQQIFGKDRFYTRHRQIFYDTDQIIEKQYERIRLCNECSGWRLIFSETNEGVGLSFKIAAIIVPWLSCNLCRREALSDFDKLTESKTLDYVYFQDNEQDLFLCK